MEERSDSRLTDWLDGLARESWQLELIISGFTIFLLVGIYDPLQKLGTRLEGMDIDGQMQLTLGIPLGILTAAWFILLINLCVHVIFRGLWISTVGLRSVSDDIDFEVLKLQPRFDRFLRRRIGSFDRYIDRLEKICSILFAFTFLILFTLLAIGGMLTLLSLVNVALREWFGLENGRILDGVTIFLLVTGFIYFIDFVTLARLKRIRWFAPIYYPIYRFFSVVTLASLYRPLYYNLIDNRFGRRVGFLLVPYIIFLMVASSAKYVTNTYFPNPRNNDLFGLVYYDDQRPEDEISHRASIPSRYIKNGFLELFLPYNPNTDDESIERLCPDLHVVNNTGFTLEGVININQRIGGINRDSLLWCISGIQRVFINDSLHPDPDFRFYMHPQREDNGLFTILDVQYLQRGEHQLRVETQRLKSDSLVWTETARIPFWKE